MALAQPIDRAPPRNAADGIGDYVRHRPEDTVLFDIVRGHLDELLDAAREHNQRPLPRYVEEQVRNHSRVRSMSATSHGITGRQGVWESALGRNGRRDRGAD